MLVLSPENGAAATSNYTEQLEKIIKTFWGLIRESVGCYRHLHRLQQCLGPASPPRNTHALFEELDHDSLLLKQWSMLSQNRLRLAYSKEMMIFFFHTIKYLKAEKNTEFICAFNFIIEYPLVGKDNIQGKILGYFLRGKYERPVLHGGKCIFPWQKSLNE